MTLYIVHVGTGTIIDASDDVLLINADDLTKKELERFDYEDIEAVAHKGIDIMKVIASSAHSPASWSVLDCFAIGHGEKKAVLREKKKKGKKK